MSKKAVTCIVIVSAALCASCATPPPDQFTINGQRRFEEQMKGYPDRDSRAQDKAREAEAAKDSMLTGKVK